MAGTNDDDDDDVFHDRAGNYCTIHLLSVTTFAKCVCVCVCANELFCCIYLYFSTDNKLCRFLSLDV